MRERARVSMSKERKKERKKEYDISSSVSDLWGHLQSLQLLAVSCILLSALANPV